LADSATAVLAYRTRVTALAIVLASRFSGTILQLAFTVLLARALGAQDSAYAFTWMAWSVFAAALLSFGAPAFVLRQVSSIGTGGRVSLGRLYGQIAGAGVVAACVVAFLGAAVPGWMPAPYDHLVLLAAVTGCALLILEVTTSALIGIRREREAIFLRFVCPPLSLCLLLLGFIALARAPSIDAIVGTNVSVLLVLAVIGHRQYRRRVSPALATSSRRSTAATRKRLWSINVVNALYMVFPFVVLPYYAPAHEIAHFAIGYRLTTVAQTVSVALGSYFSPRFVSAHCNRDAGNLRLLFHYSQIASVAVLLPFVVFLSPYGAAILTLFGEEFAGAWIYLAVPAAARLLIAGCGLTEQFLTMTRHEPSELLASTVALALLVTVALPVAGVHGVLGVCFVFYGLSVLKYFMTCAASLLTLYRGGAAAWPDESDSLDVESESGAYPSAMGPAATASARGPA
jgi:O-antigen/teichoic acid export membrane protein